MTRRRSLVVLTLAVVTAAWASAFVVEAAPSAPPVLVSQVSNDPDVAAGEAWVATDPLDPQTVMVVWLGTRDINDPAWIMTPGYCGVAVSGDGGRTWSRKELPFGEATSPRQVSRTDELPICGDPVAGVGPHGELYAAAANVGSPSFTQSVTSFDHGWSWTRPTEVFGASHTTMGVIANAPHPTPSLSMGRAYLTVDPIKGDIAIHSQEDGGAEARFLSVSSDRGATWSTPRPIDPELQSRTAGPPSAAFGKIGLVYTVDMTSPSYAGAPSPSIKCQQGQTTCAVFATTTDKGVTWTRRVMKVGDVPDGFSGAITAADPSRPDRFAVLLTTKSGAAMAVWVTEDGGRTWQERSTFAPPRGTFSKQWIAYGPTGALGVVWRTPNTNGGADVTAAVSRDGGGTFKTVPLATGVPTGGLFIGDDCACNLHLDATTLSATWTEFRSNQRQMFYGRFDWRKL